MSKRSAEDICLNELESAAVALEETKDTAEHPYAFHVCGPRNVPSLTWRDIISSNWNDENYKRSVFACFIQAVYLLELDRQEYRTQDNAVSALAPKWWTPFKYKLAQILHDERDGSIFGAVLEWDRSAALSDLIVMRPSGAPRAILALRGTLLKSPTIRRDIEDDLRFLAWESLKGSVRFKLALDALRSLSEVYGSRNVCVAGHSLGAGFALQVGKALAKQGIYVEAHLFNPPSVSLAMSLRNFGEKAEYVWNRFIKSILPSSSTDSQGSSSSSSSYEGGVGGGNKTPISGLKNWVPHFYWHKEENAELKKWVPHLYVNNSDYICCSYTDPDGTEGNSSGKENVDPTGGQVAAKLFVLSKGKQKFLEAHGLEQWWSDDLELQRALHTSKLISRQLKSLYSLPAKLTK